MCHDVVGPGMLAVIIIIAMIYGILFGLMIQGCWERGCRLPSFHQVAPNRTPSTEIVTNGESGPTDTNQVSV